MLEGFEYDGSVDWWALGVVMYDMLVGQPPFYGAHQDQLFDSIVEAQVQFPDWLSKKAVSIIKGVNIPTRLVFAFLFFIFDTFFSFILT